MKIIVLHGSDVVKSYERLKKFIDTARSRSWEVSFVDESENTLEENLSAMSLFGSERFFILRDIKRLGKKETTWLKKKYTDLPGNLIIYHEGELGKTFINSLPNPKIEEFKLPKLVWSFLELLRPGAAGELVRMFHKIIEREPAEFVFALMAKQFRDLYWVKTSQVLTGIPTWKVGKLKSQANKFTPKKLKEIIERLAEMDINVKTGKEQLISSLDLLIIKLLE